MAAVAGKGGEQAAEAGTPLYPHRALLRRFLPTGRQRAGASPPPSLYFPPRRFSIGPHFPQFSQ